jgi:hypothetical protein
VAWTARAGDERALSVCPLTDKTPAIRVPGVFCCPEPAQGQGEQHAGTVRHRTADRAEARRHGRGRQGLAEYDASKSNGDTPNYLVLIVRDKEQNVVGGLVGASCLGWLQVQAV